jgi:serine/threonine protein kinase
LCRKLDVDQTSFMPTAYGGAAAGTAGWRAPEILRGEVNVDMAALDVSNGGIGSSSSSGSGNATSGTRLTRSVDVFALGCLFFYVLSGGDHAFGDRFERDVNILRDEKRLGWLERLGEEGFEAIGLIEKMLSPDPRKRSVYFPDIMRYFLTIHAHVDLTQRNASCIHSSGPRVADWLSSRMLRTGSRLWNETRVSLVSSLSKLVRLKSLGTTGNDDWTRCSSTIWVNLESTT